MIDGYGKETVAAAGTVWVCGACGKQARCRYEGGLSRGWDESCMLHAVLCYEKEIHDQNWIAVQPSE